MKYCSPVINLKTKKNIIAINDKSCLTLKILKKLIKSWNNTNPNDKINLNQSAESLYSSLKRKFNNEEDVFWFDNEIISSLLNYNEIDRIKKLYYKPIAPSEWNNNPDTWLSNLDINAILKQYEDAIPQFKSYGALPIDFDLKKGNICIIDNICNISLKKLSSQGKQYIGIVFNLDKHYQSGSHWIALFVNLNLGEINFWDSVANSPPTEVVNLMNKLKKQMYKLNIKPKININTIKHQYGNNECGMYSLHFIIQQLKGDTFYKICNNIVNDAKMNAMRKDYFIYKPKTIKNKTKKWTGFFN